MDLLIRFIYLFFKCYNKIFFFNLQALVGQSLGKTRIPIKLDSILYKAIVAHSSSDEISIINEWYQKRVDNSYELKPDSG